MRNYWDGLKFGLLLQFAVGPMCLMVFNTAQNSGFFVALSLVLAIALVDAFYILLASLGASKILERTAVKQAVKVIGSAVLILFGLNIFLNVFGINLIPGLAVSAHSSSVFFQGLILTLSNPITIVFWGSVLTTKIVEQQFSRQELTVFSLGLVSATLFFLTAVAACGTVLSSFIPNAVIEGLNIAVGLLIIYFGIRLLLKKQ